MIGISTGFDSYIPCFLPCKIVFVHENSHKLCHCHSGVCIVKLESNFLIELSDIVMLTHILGNCFLHRSGNEEILLFQAQLFARIMIVVGIKYLDNILCQICLFYGLLIISFVKGIQMETLYRLRIPDAQSVYNTIAIADNRKIIGNCPYTLITFLYKIASSIFVNTHIHIAAKFNLFGILRSSKLKGITVHQPVIRYLYLVAVPDFLLKHTVAVPDTAAVSCISQSRKGIQKAGSKTSQTSVSKGRIRFLIFDYIQVKTQLIHCLLHWLISLQINDIIAKSTSHQKFHGQIIHSLRILFIIFFMGS